METLKDLDPKGQRRTLLIECSLLLEPGHIYGRIASALLNLSRVASIKYCTTKGFLELCEELRLEEQLLVILKDADRLLRDDPMILWTLLHLRRLLIKPPHIQFLLSSGMQFEEFIPVFDGVIPVIVRSTTPKMIDIIEMVVIEACPMDMQQSTYRGIVQNVYALAKDQIHDARGLKALVCKILPTLRELSIQRNIPLEATARLYQAASGPMKGLVNGDILRALYIAQVRRLRVEEKYLLIAAYLAANNPTKFDLKLFGNVGRGARVRKQNQKTIIKTHNKGLRMIPKIFPLDRLMAIFYYIVNCSPIPSLYTVQTSIHNLTEQQLLYRVTNMAKLDMPKFRCHLPIDFISLISRDVTFDITKYLIISNQ